MTENEIKAKTLIVGRQLEREDWPRMGVSDAYTFCEERARRAGATDENDIKAITIGAMRYVMEGGSTRPHPGAELDDAEIEDQMKNPIARCRSCNRPWLRSGLDGGLCPDCRNPRTPMAGASLSDDDVRETAGAEKDTASEDFTERHLEKWLDANVADDERQIVESQMRDFMRDDPEYAATHSWPEIRRAAAIQYAPLRKPQPAGVRIGGFDV